MMYIGIDPGKKGAMALINNNNRVLIIPFDKESYIITFSKIISKEPSICYIEDVHAVQGNGVTSSFNFGLNYGWTIGLLECFGIKYEKVSPMKWKKYFELGKDKKESIAKARELFPNVNLKLTMRCRTDSDGMAEALLICEYGRRKEKGLL